MAHQVADLVDQFVRLDAFLMDFIFEAALKLSSLTGTFWLATSNHHMCIVRENLT